MSISSSKVSYSFDSLKENATNLKKTLEQVPEKIIKKVAPYIIPITVLNLLFALIIIFMGLGYKYPFLYYFAIAPAVLFFVAFLALMLQLALKRQREVDRASYKYDNAPIALSSIIVLYKYIGYISILASALMIVLAICMTFMSNPKPEIYITLWTFAGISLIFSVIIISIGYKTGEIFKKELGKEINRENLDPETVFGVTESKVRRYPPPSLS